jgi:hypothetical protein
LLVAAWPLMGLTASLRSPAVTFSLSRRHRLDPTIEYFGF